MPKRKASATGRRAPRLVADGRRLRYFLRACILLLLGECAAHGYELVERLEVFGFSRRDSALVYRTLRGLEAEGLARSWWEESPGAPPRRVYELTGEGALRLSAQATALRRSLRLLEQFSRRYGHVLEAGRAAS